MDTQENTKKRGPRESPKDRGEKSSKAYDSPEISEPHGKDERPEEATDSEEPDLNPDMVDYLQMTSSMIDGRQVSRSETVEMIERVLRQHSIGDEKLSDYVLKVLKRELEDFKREHPP